MVNLKDKNVLIIGGLGWLGSAYTSRLVESDAQVIVLDYFNIEDWKEKLGNKIINKIDYYQFNGYDHDNFKKLLEEILSKYKIIHALINNAFDFSANTGFTIERNTFEKSSIKDWLNTFDSGMIWPMLATQVMLKQKVIKNFRIVNIASMYGIVAPNPDNYNNTNAFMLPQYGMAKAGIINFTKYIASYYGKGGVLCNAIAPGAFPKEEVIDDIFKANLLKNIPLNKLGKPEYLVEIAKFLISDENQYITGQTIVVDGGWTIR